jgi:membrane protein
MQTIEHAFNLIWRVSTRRRLLQRVLTYWAVLTLGPILLGASLSLTSYLVSYSLGYVAFIPELGVVVLKIVPLLITSLAFALLYFAVPNRHVPFRHALIGGVTAGLGLGLMSKGFAAYILHFSGYTLVYGAFASLPVFLLWIYLSWLVVVSGAVVAASLPYWRGGMWRVERTAGRRYFDALCVLQSLCRAQRRGEVLALTALQHETHVPLEELEDILLQLLDAHWVARTGGQRWLLSAHPGDIALLEVFHRFVFKPGEDLPADSDANLATLSERASSSLEMALSGSLEDLCATPEQG